MHGRCIANCFTTEDMGKITLLTYIAHQWWKRNVYTIKFREETDTIESTLTRDVEAIHVHQTVRINQRLRLFKTESAQLVLEVSCFPKSIYPKYRGYLSYTPSIVGISYIPQASWVSRITMPTI